MKVSLNGEFGVVTDGFAEGADFVNQDQSNSGSLTNFGLIRWDTEKEADFEDWTGLFGSFKDIGGYEIASEHQFRFMNDDGTAKIEKR